MSKDPIKMVKETIKSYEDSQSILESEIISIVRDMAIAIVRYEKINELKKRLFKVKKLKKEA